jgi:two-component sensor histidine kinase
VVEPERKGFGARLLERGLARDLEGNARLAFEPDGVRFTLRCPLSTRISLA